MNFKTLDIEQTSIWIGNIEKTIKFLETLNDYHESRMAQMDQEYTDFYRKGWRRFFNDDEYWISPYGYVYPMGGMIKARKITPLSYAENNLRNFIDYLYKDKHIELKEAHERWVKYAKQPLEVHESDIIFYQKMKRFHEKLTEIAQNLGIKYEAFDLDEDCKNCS